MSKVSHSISLIVILSLLVGFLGDAQQEGGSFEFIPNQQANIVGFNASEFVAGLQDQGANIQLGKPEVVPDLEIIHLQTRLILTIIDLQSHCQDAVKHFCDEEQPTVVEEVYGESWIKPSYIACAENLLHHVQGLSDSCRPLVYEFKIARRLLLLKKQGPHRVLDWMLIFAFRQMPEFVLPGLDKQPTWMVQDKDSTLMWGDKADDTLFLLPFVFLCSISIVLNIVPMVLVAVHLLRKRRSIMATIAVDGDIRTAVSAGTGIREGRLVRTTVDERERIVSLRYIYSTPAVKNMVEMSLGREIGATPPASPRYFQTTNKPKVRWFPWLLLILSFLLLPSIMTLVISLLISVCRFLYGATFGWNQSPSVCCQCGKQSSDRDIPPCDGCSGTGVCTVHCVACTDFLDHKFPHQMRGKKDKED